jgi:hypothetical protein
MAEKKTTQKKTNTAKTTEPEVKKQEEPAEPQASDRRRINVGAIFWGMLLVVVGTLILLDNFNVLDVELSNAFQLWPLAIIAIGLSILSLKGWVATFISTVFVIISLAAVIIVTTTGYTGFNRSDATYTTSITQRSDIQNARVEVKAGAGKLVIGSESNQSEVVTAQLESTHASLRENSWRDGDTQRVEIGISDSSNWWIGNWHNDLFVQLSESLPMELAVNAGASTVDADVSNVQLSRLNMDVGASTTTLTLGDKADELNVNIKAGASSLTVRVPRDAGVSVRTQGGLSSSNFDGLQEVGDRYETEGFTDAQKKITIDAEVGAASFRLQRY